MKAGVGKIVSLCASFMKIGSLARFGCWPVILHFGGNLPYSRFLTRLAELQNAFGKDLVIVAIFHYASMEDLERAWGDRNLRVIGRLPFRVAIDGEESTDPDDVSKPRSGVTHKRYDVGPGLRTVLIDIMGNVAGEINIDSGMDLEGEGKDVVRQALGIPQKDSAIPARKVRFNEVYRLDEGQVLKRIAPPLIPERALYCTNGRVNKAKFADPGPLIFHWIGGLRRWGYSSADLDLAAALSHVLRLRSFEYDGPAELLKLALPGDWIIRDGTSPEEKLQALGQMITEELGRSIQFEKRTVTRDVIVATGKFKFHPPTDTYENTSVHMYAGEPDADEGAGGGTAQSVRELLQILGDRANMPVIDNTEQRGRISIPYRHHSSSYLGNIRDEQKRMEMLSMLLDNVTTQTDLWFQVERQPVEVWFITEAASH